MTMPHGLSESFLADLQKGRLAWLAEYVRRDQTLGLEIRADKIQVYYRGGRLMLVEYRGRDDRYCATFDDKYICSGLLRRRTYPDDASRGKEWTDAIPMLKREMDFWFATKKQGNEREFQQVLVRENNTDRRLANSTDYFLCSMEYQTTRGRFDVVGVHWPSDRVSRKHDEDLPLALIEMKYGDKAINGRAGLVEHLNDFENLARDEIRLKEFCREMTTVMQQKHDLGLIPGCKRRPASVSAAKLHVIFVLANTDIESSCLIAALDEVAGRSLEVFPGGVWFVFNVSDFGNRCA